MYFNQFIHCQVVCCWVKLVAKNATHLLVVNSLYSQSKINQNKNVEKITNIV